MYLLFVRRVRPEPGKGVQGETKPVHKNKRGQLRTVLYSLGMNTWTPVWSKLPDSSIWLESKEVKILFMTMLAIKDRDHVVRYSAFELARKANLTEQEVLDSLKVLESPDTKRLEPQEHEGRRIARVEDGWLMLNGEKYRRKMQEVYRKEYKRVKQAEYRQEEETEPDLIPQEPGEPKPWQPDPIQLRLGNLFKRRPTTRWNKSEIKSLKDVGEISEEDLVLLETYYTARHKQGEDYRRRDLATLLNNFNGELDRARKYKPTTCF
jgi:hypothetical protein